MDLNKTSALHMARQKMAWLTERQKVIAENVANADTPGYKAQETETFQSFVNNSKTTLGAKITNPNHISSKGESKLRITDDKFAWTQKPNGNTVSLEQQTIKSTEIRDMHSLATSLYKKSYALYRTALGSN